MRRSTIHTLAFLLFLGLFFWGGYALIVYYGVPIHGKVLLNQEGWEHVASVCGLDRFFCRGLIALFPSVVRTIGRAHEFYWYAILAMVGYGAFLGWHAYRYGHVRLTLSLKPWHILLFFLCALWLQFSVLTSASFLQNGKETTLRRIITPHPSVYTSDNAEGLEVLQENFSRLQQGGCLRKVRQINTDVAEYSYGMRCIQQSFFTRVLPQVLFQLFLLLLLLTVGRAVLHWLRLRPEGVFPESVLSLGVGACSMIALLWLLAVVGIFTQAAGWIVLAALLFAGYRHARYWLRTFLSHTWEVSRPWHSFTLLCAFLLVSYLALNFLVVVRPFPIGWDDLGSYLNRPRLLVSYGTFIHSMAPFQWEYLSALGYLLYGFNSTFGATVSMMINWLAGLIALLVVMLFARRFLGPRAGVFSALLYYTLPLVGHFSFADMKTDNAVFSFQALSIFCLFVFLFPFTRTDAEDESAPPDRRWQWLFLSGMFCAFAFGTKVTSIMVLMALGGVLVGVLLHWTAFIGVIPLAFFVFTQQGAFNVAEVMGRVGWDFITPGAFLLASGILGIALLLIACWNARRSIGTALRAGGILLVSFFVCIAPWVLHNNIQAGNVVPRFLLTAPNKFAPILSFRGEDASGDSRVHTLPKELAVDPSHPACAPTGFEEELGRYWGFRQGWGHYLTLPWRTVMNIDSFGYYVTTEPLLLVWPFLLLLPFFWIPNRAKWLRWLFAGTAFLLLQWVFLANGVPWYGIGVFLGLVICLEALFLHAPDRMNRSVLSVLILMSLLSVFSHRFWQYDQQRNLLEYSMGKASAEVIRERTIPHYDDITDVLMAVQTEMPERPYLYRVGTFIPYFIPKNLEVIGIADHQLDTFACLHQEQDNELTLARLKGLGFSSIIFDTNTATIEQDPNGSLHQKVQAFVDFLNTVAPEHLTVVVNDFEGGVVFLLLP
ncbi:MAG: glycosyltransferase family 39 protein [Candidatus Peribacteraceae bacterium]|nr:glycosyltransferase family 39 protein [Candidatus Peribacteraceae bacterium]